MYTTLVDARTLAAHLDDPHWVVVDCRFDLTNAAAGRAQYAAGHIPGARFFSVDDDLSGPKTDRSGRHPLPDPHAFAARLGAAGIGNATQVVAYDAQGGVFASRLWWMLRWVGHEAAAVLDGGLGDWIKAGHPVTAQLPQVTAARFDPRMQPIAVDADDVLGGLADAGRRIVDARAADRYRGENETLDPVGGHIPGALHRFYKDNLDAGGRMKPPAQLRAEWLALLGAIPPAAVVHQCGSGVSACVNLLALEVAGLAGGRLYPGSWSEWCADPSRPMRTGPSP